MDPNECLQILQQRCLECSIKRPIASADSDSNAKEESTDDFIYCGTCNTSTANNPRGRAVEDGKEEDEFHSLSPMELLSLFESLQAERVTSYKQYDETLNYLIENERVAEYPSLCTVFFNLQLIIKFNLINTY